MEGRTIVPGLIDSHILLQQYPIGLDKIDSQATNLAVIECIERFKTLNFFA